jgi:hypothetical protein
MIQITITNESVEGVVATSGNIRISTSDTVRAGEVRALWATIQNENFVGRVKELLRQSCSAHELNPDELLS